MTERLFHNANALVTGASQGLGREIAVALIQSGANVCLCARTAPDLEKTAQELRDQFPTAKIASLPTDIADTDQLDRLYDFALSALGQLDVVVNNAGVHGPLGKIQDIDWRQWSNAINANLLGTAYSCRRAIDHFVRTHRKGAHRKIINLSGGGATAPQPGLSAYGASKAAVVRLTETLAHETREFDIDINAVAPGALATRLMKELHAAGPDAIGSDYHSRVQGLISKGGMSITNAAALCVYLASPQSDGITGRLISAAWDPWPFTDDVIKDISASDIYTLRRITAADRGHSWGDK